MAYVDSGTATLAIAGQPSRSLSAGDSFSIAQGTVHALANVGPGPLTVISTYIVERGQPIAIPAR
jgi:quercetin dioxygenase-like cupin family protein